MAREKKTTINEPKKYEVLHDFTDLEDGRKVYSASDRYPNPVNKKVEPERLATLLSKNNNQNRPVIKEI